MVGSLAGVAASQRVTGVCNSKFNLNSEVKYNGKICLTERLANQSGTKVGHSDPIMLSGKVIDQRIKGTPGITG